MSPTCIRDGCPGRPELGHQYCLLCGHVLATCDVSPIDGLVFYEKWPAEGHRVTVKNDGNVDTRVQYYAPHHRVRSLPGTDDTADAELSLLDASSGLTNGEVFVPARGSVILQIIPQPFADRVSSLTLQSPVRALVRIPLYTSQSARIDVRRGNQRLSRDRPNELFPNEDNSLTWTLELVPQGGAVRLTSVSSDTLGFEVPALPIGGVTVPAMRPFPVDATWRSSTSNDQPQRATLKVEADGIALTTVELMLYPRRAIHLQQTARPAVLAARSAGAEVVDTLHIGGRPQYVHVDLWNEGFKKVRISHVTCATHHVELHGAMVGTSFYPCSRDGVPPNDVQKAPLASTSPGGSPSPADATALRSLLFAVSPDYVPANGLLRFNLQLTLAAVPQASPLGTIRSAQPDVSAITLPVATAPLADVAAGSMSQSLTISLAAQRIADAADDDLLCIDFGTIHTSAIMLSGGRYQPVTFAELHRSGDQAPLEFVKSAYRVKSWRPRHFEYGEKVWESLHAQYAHIDYLIKLRLGGSHLRLVTDDRHEPNRVSGTDGAEVLLSEIINQVAERVGVRPRHLRLTVPAAFDETAIADLKKALSRVGFAENLVEVACTEPEAYLWHMCSDGKFLKKLRATVTPELPLAGDHRPDIQERRGSHRSGVERIQSTNERAKQAEPKEERRLRTTSSGSILGFVFDMGGGTTDVTLFEFYPADQRIEMVASHGYRWLGGEMLTAQIARLLHQGVSNHGNFPFPEVASDRTFSVKQLEGGDYANANFNVVRREAEEFKHKPENRSLLLSLLDRVGKRSNDLSVKVDPDKVEKRMSEIIGPAVDDTLNRISRMYEAGHLTSGEPRFVALAGNGAQLWCLQRILAQRLNEAGVRDPDIHFDKDLCRRGVVEGLSTWGKAGGRVVISRREADGHWWYLPIHAAYHLLMPAGAARGLSQNPPDRKRPLLNELFQILPNFPLWWGNGPDPEVRLRDAHLFNFRTEWSVATGVAAGCRAYIAMGIDDSGTPGLWLKRQDEDWQWFKAVRRA
jgi:hypothetical protein